MSTPRASAPRRVPFVAYLFQCWVETEMTFFVNGRLATTTKVTFLSQQCCCMTNIGLYTKTARQYSPKSEGRCIPIFLLQRPKKRIDVKFSYPRAKKAAANDKHMSAYSSIQRSPLLLHGIAVEPRRQPPLVQFLFQCDNLLQARRLLDPLL